MIRRPIVEAMRMHYLTDKADESQSAYDALASLGVDLSRLQTALEEAEWNGSAWIGFETCPVCSNERADGHATDCPVAAALAGLGEARESPNEAPSGPVAPTGAPPAKAEDVENGWPKPYPQTAARGAWWCAGRPTP